MNTDETNQPTTPVPVGTPRTPEFRYIGEFYESCLTHSKIGQVVVAAEYYHELSEAFARVSARLAEVEGENELWNAKLEEKDRRHTSLLEFARALQTDIRELGKIPVGTSLRDGVSSLRAQLSDLQRANEEAKAEHKKLLDFARSLQADIRALGQIPVGTSLRDGVSALRAHVAQLTRERDEALKIISDVRESIACFLPTDCNIMERPTLSALNQVFRAVTQLRYQVGAAQTERDDLRTRLAAALGNLPPDLQAIRERAEKAEKRHEEAAWEIFNELKSASRTPVCPRIAAIIAKHDPASQDIPTLLSRLSEVLSIAKGLAEAGEYAEAALMPGLVGHQYPEGTANTITRLRAAIDEYDKALADWDGVRGGTSET